MDRVLCKLQRAYRALGRTGLLSPVPLLALVQLLLCWLRFGSSVYMLAAWGAWRFPHRTALVEPGQAVTYGQLLVRADQLAGALEQTYSPKTIGILGRNRIAYVEGLLACARLGADTVLLNTMDGPEQLRAFFQSQKVDLLLCDREFQPRVETALQPIRLEQRPPIVGLETGPDHPLALPQSRASIFPPSLALRPRSGSLILLTSGTTGPAKKVRRKPTLEEALGLLTSLLESLQPRTGDATLLTVPLLHGHGLATLVLSLALGSPLFLFPRASAEDFLHCIEERRIKVLVVVPTILYRLLEAVRPQQDLGSLRAIFCGSAPLDGGLATRTLERFGDVLYNLYGSSETGVISLATPEDLRQAPATVGTVLPGVELRILDERRSPVAAGELGNIHILRDGGAIPTGDVGYLDAAGRLFLLGRADDMLICGGENVFPEVIETKIQQALEYVLQAAVIGLPDPEYGQAIHLFVVLKPGPPEVTPERIAQDLEPLFPRTLRPKKITVVGHIPRNLAGKILRHKLRTAEGAREA